MTKTKFFLSLIIILILVTRLYKISDIPVSVYWDEASIGYNAYSITKTGLDEWADLLPIHFRAFGEFKLPVYIYSTAFFVQLFGLNAFSVRISSVLFSLLIIILTFLLSKKVFIDEKVGLLSAFLLTISPWFFIFSRTGYEATAGIAFYLLALYLLFFSQKSRLFLFLSLGSFILTLYSYNSFRIITPLTILILFLYFAIKQKNIIWKFKWELTCLTALFSLSWIPIIRLVLLDNGNSRLLAVGISGSSSKIEFILMFVKNYLSHFNPSFLFFAGDPNLRSHLPGFGQLYLSDLPFLLLGIWKIIKSKNIHFILLICLFLISFIPASLTKESPHALRSLLAAPFFCILTAVGIVYLYTKFKWFLPLIFMTYLLLFVIFYSSFLTSYPIKSAISWQFPYKQIFTEYPLKFKDYKKVYISDSLAQPYIFGLFYLKEDPPAFFKTVELNPIDKWGFSKVYSFNNFVFRQVDLDEKDYQIEADSIIFTTKRSKILVPINEIKDPDGQTVFYVYTN